MDIVKKEIKEALLGDLVPMDRRLVVSGMRRVKYRNGLRDGFGSVLIMGVMCSRRWYMTKKSSKQIRELTVKAMQDMGRMMALGSLPEAEAVYCTYLLNHPAILTFTQGKDGIIEMAAYSARDLSGMLAAYRTLNRFQKALHDNLERMSEEGEQKRQNAIKEHGAEEKRREKQAKIDRKQAKKQAKKQEKERKRQNGILSLLGKNAKAGNAEKQEKPKQEQKRSLKQDREQRQEAKLTAELTEAKLAAEAAAARLAAAEARLAAEQAQAKLAEMQAKLAAEQTQATAQVQATGQTQTAQTQAAEQLQEPAGHSDASESMRVGNKSSKGSNGSSNKGSGGSTNNSSNSSNNGSSGNSRKKNRKKKK